MNEIRWLRRIAAAAVLAVAGVLLGLDAVHAQEQVPPTTTTTATAPAAADDRDNRWLSGVTLVATLGIGGALCFLVDRDRKGARAAQVAALAGGASDVAPIETPLRTLGVDEAGVDSPSSPPPRPCSSGRPAGSTPAGAATRSSPSGRSTRPTPSPSSRPAAWPGAWTSAGSRPAGSP